MIDASAIRDRFVALAPYLDERGRRSFAAAEARSAGYGGIAAVARATGIVTDTNDRQTIAWQKRSTQATFNSLFGTTVARLYRITRHRRGRLRLVAITGGEY